MTKEFNDMTIREMRKATGMTQDEMSARFGIPKRTLASWESNAPSGRKCPEYTRRMIAAQLANTEL